jgi:hypothetical protein
MPRNIGSMIDGKSARNATCGLWEFCCSGIDKTSFRHAVEIDATSTARLPTWSAGMRRRYSKGGDTGKGCATNVLS